MSRKGSVSQAWVGGFHTVRSLLKSDPQHISELLHVEGRRDRRLKELLMLAGAAGIPIRCTVREEIGRLARTDAHQGVLVRYTGSAPGDESSLFRRLDTIDGAGLVLALDGVQDPHNLGACLRAADGAGTDAVVVSLHDSAGVTPVVRKVASGAAESLSIYQVVNLPRTLKRLQQIGYWVYGAAGEAENDLFTLHFAAPTVLVLGAEGRGLARLTRQCCDELFSIPMHGQVDSLNVSVATGIALFEVRRQRHRSAPVPDSTKPVVIDHSG